MSSVLKYSELNGRCLAILRLGGTIVDENLTSTTVEVVATSTESSQASTSGSPPAPTGTTEGKQTVNITLGSDH